MKDTGSDDEDEDDDLMDDDAMLKMDDQLAAVFRMQQGPRAGKKKAQGTNEERLENDETFLIDSFF